MTNKEEKNSPATTSKQKPDNPSARGGQAVAGGGGKKPFKKAPVKNNKKEEYDQKILDIARVTRVMAGGKRMSFRACVAVGDKNGKIGIGLSKGADVAAAVSKAADKAKKDMVTVPMVNTTIPHEIKYKFGAAEILFKPSGQGRGIIAGGVVRVILELSGIKDITSKILGTNNKVNNAKCTLEALRNLKKVDASRFEDQEAKTNNIKKEKEEEKQETGVSKDKEKTQESK